MFRGRRWMRRFGGFGWPGGYGGYGGYGYGRPWRHYRRPMMGCFPGCCLGLVLPGLLLMGLVFAVVLHLI